MQKLLLTIATMLSLATPAVALEQPKIQSRVTPPQTSANKAYLDILNKALAQGAPDYLKISDRDKLSYGYRTCEALEANVSLDTLFFDYVKSVMKDIPPKQQQQAGFLLGSSMYAGVYSFCPKHLPQLNEWGKKRFTDQ